LTLIALLAAVVAILAPVGMLAVVVGALPDRVLGAFFVSWVISLITMVGVTKYLRAIRDSHQPPA
jgi:hypothetical protein